ncbi:MAG: zinc ribbon domain-containing protein [Tissierellia bacterium]|nr:zinc ribbon domain-containing protein [Tissierellia bacterium]MDD4437447.1 zinc ribbon domain-containing protein [Tissierellia bacterium]
MALIKCPECGKEISDKGVDCIHCGYPIHESFDNKTAEPDKEIIYNDDYQTENTYADNNNIINKIAGNKALIAVISIVVLLIIISASIKNQDSPTYVAERFIELALEGKLKEAKKYLGEEIPWDTSVKAPNNVRIKIKSSVEDIRGDEAMVHLEFDEIPEPVYGGNPQYVSIYLVRVDDKWKIYDMQ